MKIINSVKMDATKLDQPLCDSGRKMDYIYFEFIHRDLCLIGEHAKWTDEEVLDKLQVLKMELRFLERFSRCFATEGDGFRWDDTLEGERDGRRSLASCLSDIHGGDGQDWPRLASALVAKIELSKLDIERLLHGSLISEPSRTDEILIFLDTVLNNLKDLSRYTRNNVSPEIQRATLEEKLVFLKDLLEVDASCIYSEEFRGFKTSVHNFAKESAKLTFMYWVNAREERIDLMISDMLQKIDRTTHGIIRFGSGLQLGRQIHASLNNLGDISSYKKIVRFDKQVKILKRTVEFLKEVRRFAANGMDRNESLEFKTWVHVIGQETAHLTLECWLLDERFRKIGKKIYIRLVRPVPHSASREDTGSRNHHILIFFLQSVLNNLNDIVSYIRNISCRADEIVPFEREMEILEWRIGLLQNFWRLAANGINRNEFRKFKTWSHAFALSLACLTLDCWSIAADEDFVKLRVMLSEMRQKLQPRRGHINAYLLQSLKYKAVKRYEIPIFLDALQDNLKHLVSYDVEDETESSERLTEIQEKKRQTEMLEEKVVFLKSFCKLAANGIDGMEFGKYMTCVQVFAENVACLTLQCWLISADEEFSTKRDLLLPEMLEELQPCMPHVTASFFGIFWQSDLLLLGQTVSSFVDLLLDNFSTHLKDDFQMLRDGLIFLLTFVAVPPSNGAKNLFLVHKKINILLHEGSCLISPEKEKRTSEVPLYCFVRKIELEISNIKQLYFKIPDLSSYNFPRIIGQGFLDFLIQNLRALKEKQTTDTRCLPFAKYKIMRIEEELVSLTPFFNGIMEVQDEQKELKLQVIDLVHLAEHVTNLCFESDHPVWYHMASLSDVLDRIKVVKTKIELMKECITYKVGALSHSASSLGIISDPVRATEINEVVGFEEAENTIIENLVRGPKSFDIVSIVGMVGLGKTTLARKVYGNPKVRRYFHICAFCSVSRDHRPGRLLHEILSQIDDDKHLSLMNEDDLAHRLHQCLSQQKYLIVLDDIWDIRAWKDVKNSFPDDQNGSRVMFTTRSREVALQAETKCSPYALSFLSEEKSWELLQRKVLYNDSPRPDLSAVGKLIAKNCKGLPLAVVVISGLLATKEKSLSQWTEMSERVGFYLSEEGLMEILELSYKHLPEHLKPCLLYFGGFPQDMMIPTKILMLLWVAEGFVEESERKASVKMANKYLNDLADRSLIMINGRSSRGGIKSFRVHDLIRDFCQKKAREENFCFLEPRCVASSYLHCSIDNHYRVSLQFTSFIDDAIPQFPSMHSLFCFSRYFGFFDIQSIAERFKLLQVLYLKFKWLEGRDLEWLTRLVHLRHIVAPVNHVDSVPSSISSLWKLETLILRTLWKGEVLLPETIWTMTRLRHVNISRCKLTFFGGHGHEGYPQLGNVESFSSPTLSTGEDVQQLLQGLPAVRKLGCRFDKSNDSGNGQVEKLDFDSEIESLNLTYVGERSPYVMIFPSTLKKLKLVGFKLPWTAISDISKLPCLEVLKLLRDSFVGNSWDMEDVEFPSLKFLKMDGLNLVNWRASTESFCCLEQLFVTGCARLIEIPLCLGEVTTLRRLQVHACNSEAEKLALEIKKAQSDLGNELLP